MVWYYLWALDDLVFVLQVASLRESSLYSTVALHVASSLSCSQQEPRLLPLRWWRSSAQLLLLEQAGKPLLTLWAMMSTNKDLGMGRQGLVASGAPACNASVWTIATASVSGVVGKDLASTVV